MTWSEAYAEFCRQEGVIIRGLPWPDGCFIWSVNRHDLLWQDGEPVFDNDFDHDGEFAVVSGGILPPPKDYNKGLRPAKVAT